MMKKTTPVKDRRYDLLWKILLRHIRERSYVQQPGENVLSTETRPGSRTEKENHSR